VAPRWHRAVHPSSARKKLVIQCSGARAPKPVATLADEAIRAGPPRNRQGNQNVIGGAREQRVVDYYTAMRLK